jgi:AraC-like DNA-binding protein
MEPIREVGKNTKEYIVSFREFPEMSVYGLRSAGISYTKYGFSFYRPKPIICQVLYCFEGKGEVLVKEKWKACSKGMAYITPPGIPHGYRALKSGSWNICWAMYLPPSAKKKPSGTPDTASPAPTTLKYGNEEPSLIQVAGEIFLSSIRGLYGESIGLKEKSIAHPLIELIHGYASRIMGPSRKLPRLSKLWEIVENQLAHDWTLPELARTSNMSSEHLRRICLKETGFAPMKQVMHLRMRRAAVLLSSEGYKIQTVANIVGYQNPFAFSTAFKKCMGNPPSEYRSQFD